VRCLLLPLPVAQLRGRWCCCRCLDLLRRLHMRSCGRSISMASVAALACTLALPVCAPSSRVCLRSAGRRCTLHAHLALHALHAPPTMLELGSPLAVLVVVSPSVLPAGAGVSRRSREGRRWASALPCRAHGLREASRRVHASHERYVRHADASLVVVVASMVTSLDWVSGLGGHTSATLSRTFSNLLDVSDSS
jgi:hypothetical protein